MDSRATDSAYKIKKSEGEQANEAIWTLSSAILQFKKNIQAARFSSIREKLERNEKKLEVLISQAFVSATTKKDICPKEKNGNILSLRIDGPLCKLSGFDLGSAEKENVNSQEEVLSSTIIFGNSNGGKSLIRLIKLPYIEKIPPYTTWIFLDRNQRMAEDQSVVGRRQIYYDQYGSEALICSDSEEEVAEPEEEKHEFSEGEDQILWKAFQEYGMNKDVLNVLSQFIEATSSEIQERYDTLKEKYKEKHFQNCEGSTETRYERSISLEKSLSAALDSFDNLFCRRCLVFDCRLHGCSQSPIIPREKQTFWSGLEENGNPCSDHCFLLGRECVQSLRSERSDTCATHGMEAITFAEKNSAFQSFGSENSKPDVEKPAIVDLETVDSGRVLATEVTLGVFYADETLVAEPLTEKTGKRQVLKNGKRPLESFNAGAENILGLADKKQKKLLATDTISMVGGELLDVDLISQKDNKNPDSEAATDDQIQKNTSSLDESTEYDSRKYMRSGNALEDETNDGIEVPTVKPSSNPEIQVEVARRGCKWNPIEKDLFLKGIEIFGKNSCLIARNLLSGLKTCIEVSKYMFDDGAAMPNRYAVMPNSGLEDNGKADPDYMEQEMPIRTRYWRRRGRSRKLKYTWKSAGHPSIRKRIADGKQQSCKQYTPCGCQQMCGKQCPCLHNGTCCEKYCGCSKSCKKRFRGCHCAKSQCRSRQCPCFAAGRECDPDVCRNCWVSCGDGSLGEPPVRGDDYQCGNMKLLLKQQQKILLGKSDVAGWGAFIKNPVNKNDYLGEYTGELINHKEADKRGKIYDRANSSFLFDLNDQYVLDAYRKGDKLKFANHSSNPNCYAKVMLVAGDHRVGIYAKERIEASEELFYDYRYGPDQAPAWARKPEGSRRDDPSVSFGRAQKIA